VTVAAILLAAGQSRRMGTCKQLLPLAGTTVIGRCLETLQAGGVSDIVVVVSPAGHDVAETALRCSGVKTAVNEDPSGDMASSVRCGRDALPAVVRSVIVAPGDIPLVQPATVQALISTAVHNPSCIIIPTHAGRRGHPLLLPCIILDELAGSLTLRDVVRSDPGRVIELDVPDAGILLDMDTPEDYRRLTAISTGTG
jgi:molybdenum cofactor cytidylyltransferase